MKKIEAYKTTDGKVFEDENLALEHEKSIAEVSAITELVERECYTGMNKTEIARFIIEYKKELVSILEV